MSFPAPTDNTPRVRLATPADAPRLVEFNLALAWETEELRLAPEVVSRGVRAALADPTRGRYFVAELDSEVAGMLMLTVEFSDWRNGWFWWIQSVYVAPESRRRGVFRALFCEVQSMANAAAGVRGLRLYVNQRNGGARKTYESLGMLNTPYLVYEVGT